MSPIPEPPIIPNPKRDPMCIGELTDADDPDEEYQEYTRAEYYAMLEAEQAAAREVKAEVTAGAEGDVETGSSPTLADSGEYAN